MKRGLIWIGFGALLLIGMLSGYAPDAALANELRAAHKEGLLPPSGSKAILPAQDGRSAFRKAMRDHEAAAERIWLHPESRRWAPNASTIRFTQATLAAANLPGRDWGQEDPFSLPHPPLRHDAFLGSGDADRYVVVAVEELTARAKNGADLREAAHVAGLLDREGNPHAAQLWAGLANVLLDRARALGVPAHAVSEELGDPPDVRRILQGRLARVVAWVERERPEGRGHNLWGAGGKRAELAYVRYWRGFFRRVGPGDAALATALGAEGPEIEREDQTVANTYFAFAVASPVMWKDWVEELGRLRRRMEA